MAVFACAQGNRMYAAAAAAHQTCPRACMTMSCTLLLAVNYFTVCCSVPALRNTWGWPKVPTWEGSIIGAAEHTYAIIDRGGGDCLPELPRTAA